MSCEDWIARLPGNDAAVNLASLPAPERQLVLAARIERVTGALELGGEKMAMARELGTRRAHAGVVKRGHEACQPAAAGGAARQRRGRKIETEGCHDGLLSTRSSSAEPVPANALIRQRNILLCAPAKSSRGRSSKIGRAH